MGTYLGQGFDGVCPCTFPPLTIGPETGGLTKGIFGTIGYQISEEFSL